AVPLCAALHFVEVRVFSFVKDKVRFWDGYPALFLERKRSNEKIMYGSCICFYCVKFNFMG
ncbi:MAG: hypothetical protein OEM27_03620, partial [Nitrospinota bacterium]|nr:hypothetical protein [Nitrospinota bacterium]